MRVLFTKAEKDCRQIVFYFLDSPKMGKRTGPQMTVCVCEAVELLTITLQSMETMTTGRNRPENI